MKTRTFLCLLTLWLGGFAFAQAQGTTAFTYQGRLAEGAAPATGLFDLRFAICDSASGGNTLGTVTSNAVPVTNGLLNVTLDFGSNVFDGSSRWLDIGVRTNGSGPDYVSLVPRQPVTPTPYAIHARNAGMLNGFAGTNYAPATGSGEYVSKRGDTMTGALNLPANGLVAGGNQLVLSGGNVGIGTTSPITKLWVDDFAGIGGVRITLHDADAGGKQWDLVNGGTAVQAVGKFSIRDSSIGANRLTIGNYSG